VAFSRDGTRIVSVSYDQTLRLWDSGTAAQPIGAPLIGHTNAVISVAPPSAWRADLDDAVAMARTTDPIAHITVVAYKYVFAIAHGVLLIDDSALEEIEEAFRIAEPTDPNIVHGTMARSTPPGSTTNPKSMGW
jgi:hypothetical protein